MNKPLLISFVVAALAAAGAESFRISLYEPAVVKGKELKAGDYNLSVKSDSVTLAQGKTKLEVPAKVENSDKKFTQTKIRYNENNGKLSIREIQLGGTKTRLLFDTGVAAGGE